MAKFADYATADQNGGVDNDSLEQEITEAREQTAARKEVPDSVRKRFDGKSVDDILEAYAHAENKISKQGEDLGKLRKTVDNLLAIQVTDQATSNNAKEPDGPGTGKPLSIDDLYEDTEGSISKVVEKTSKESKQKLEEFENELFALKVEKKKQELAKDYEGWEDEVKSEDFLDWAKQSPARTRLLVQADRYDFDAARDILELWYDKKTNTRTQQDTKRRDKQLRDATLETGSPAPVGSVPKFSRYDLMEKRIAAKNGDLKAERWLQANADAIAIAYEEKRITD